MGRTGLSRKELSRVEVMGRVKARSLRLSEAAEMLELSYRQSEADLGAISGGRSKGAAARQLWAGVEPGVHGEVSAAVLNQVQARYEDFGPTLAAEHLASDDGLEVQAETLRRWMKEAGLWQGQRRRKPYRQRREAKAHFGELVQLDGSFHEWLEERGPRGCLMHMVDDATTSAGAVLGRGNDLGGGGSVAALDRALRRAAGACTRTGRTCMCGRRMPQERERGEPAVTQFGRMCAKLGIRIIAASSPQAKGRVERAHGTHQDRLVKKLRLAGIADYEQANAYLEQHYLAEHNRRYAHARRPEPIIIGGGRRRGNWTRSSGWRRSGWSARTGWCATRTGCCNWNGKADTGRRPRVACWCGKTKQEKSRFTIAISVSGFRELKASTALGEGRGAAPSPAPPSPIPSRSLPPAANHPWRKGFQQGTHSTFQGQHETKTRGHFYCG